MSGCKDCQRFWCGFNKAVKSFRALSQDLSIITVYITEKCQAKSGKDKVIYVTLPFNIIYFAI